MLCDQEKQIIVGSRQKFFKKNKRKEKRKKNSKNFFLKKIPKIQTLISLEMS